MFYVNVPIGIALLPLAYRLLPGAEPSRRRQSLDPVGVALFGTAVLLVLLPLVEGGQNQPLADRPWWLAIPAVVLLAGCLLWERFWSSRGRETLIDLPLLRVRSYVLGLTLGMFYFAGFTAIFLVVTLYLQVGLGYSALEAGATQTPFAVGSAIAAVLGSRWVRAARPAAGGRRAGPGDRRAWSPSTCWPRRWTAWSASSWPRPSWSPGSAAGW